MVAVAPIEASVFLQVKNLVSYVTKAHDYSLCDLKIVVVVDHVPIFFIRYLSINKLLIDLRSRILRDVDLSNR